MILQDFHHLQALLWGQGSIRDGGHNHVAWPAPRPQEARDQKQKRDSRQKPHTAPSMGAATLYGKENGGIGEGRPRV